MIPAICTTSVFGPGASGGQTVRTKGIPRDQLPKSVLVVGEGI